MQTKNLTMKKFSVVILVTIVVAIIAGAACFFTQKDSMLYKVCDAVTAIGFLTFFALTAIMCAIAFKEVRRIPDHLQRKVVTILIVFVGSFAFAASFGTGTLMAIAKYQNLTGIHALPWYGKISGFMSLTIGAVLYFVATKLTRKIPYQA